MRGLFLSEAAPPSHRDAIMKSSQAKLTLGALALAVLAGTVGGLFLDDGALMLATAFITGCFGFAVAKIFNFHFGPTKR